MAQGLRIRRSDGTVQLSTEDGITTFRHLSSHLFDEYQPETAVPAPGFDEAKGVLQIVHHADRTLDEFADGFVAPNVFDVPTITHANGVLTY
ncbi:hypothetical protein KUV73_25335, partial [Mameliella alba]|nr:hypothetical protein [Mameliella alba]MBY6177698.1 hypothetical protein [Mameliella alba]